MAKEYDARLEMEGWNTNGFDDGAWKTPDVMDAPTGKLTAQQNPNIRVQETLKPVAVLIVRWKVYPGYGTEHGRLALC